ncbi:MAG: archaeal proteasome endopeptidase complex subunit alpha [Candidatus Aenigmatarchaeota archaeon]
MVELPPMKQMGYDRAIVVFSPEGRMYQVEYARKAVENLSTTAVGVVFNNGVVLAAYKEMPKLLVPESLEKISKIDEHIGMASCGILADCRVLLEYARIKAQINRMTYSEPMELVALVKDIGDRKQKMTQVGGLRPFGVGLLVAGTDGSPHLYETDPSGTVREWYAHSIGRGSKNARKLLIEEYKEGLNKDKAIALTLKALEAAEKKLVAKSVEIGIVEDGKFRVLPKEEVRELLKKTA